jgi:hypothetical protein
MQVHCFHDLFIGQTFTFGYTCQTTRTLPLDLPNDTDYPHVTCMFVKHKHIMGMQQQVLTSHGNKHW